MKQAGRQAGRWAAKSIAFLQAERDIVVHRAHRDTVPLSYSRPDSQPDTKGWVGRGECWTMKMTAG